MSTRLPCSTPSESSTTPNRSPPCSTGYRITMDEEEEDNAYAPWAQWDEGSNHCLYLPGICIHACPAFPGARRNLHLQTRPFKPGTVIAPITLKGISELHPALRPRDSKMDTLTPNVASSSRQGFLSAGPSSPYLGSPRSLPPPSPGPAPDVPDGRWLAKLIEIDQAFENTSTSVAASQMRNALNNLADTVEDPIEKKVGVDLDSHLRS